MTSGLIADGEVFGRRDRGSNARLPFGLVAGQQSVDAGPGDPVAAGHLADGTLLDRDGGDDQPGL
jgi:hypothetical protein